MKYLAFLYFICAALAVVPPLSPLSIQSDFPVPYFGPPPSSNVDPAMVGPVQLLNSTIDINLDDGTITLPLYHGTLTGSQGQNDIWYIVTDASDLQTSLTLGVHYTPKLAFVPRNLFRTATGEISFDLPNLEFDAGTVDFTPRRNVIPGQSPDFWPLDSSSSAGSQGDDQYTSLVLLPGRIVLNAPIIASSSATESDLNRYCDGISASQRTQASRLLHDKVVSICPRENRVTLQMNYAISFSRPFWFLALDVSDQLLAALEGATYVPTMADITTDCWTSANCPTEVAMAIVNGYTNASFVPPTTGTNFTIHPLRQGLDSAAAGEGYAIHVMGEIPTLGIHQSPLWDILMSQWTTFAMDQNLRTRVRDIFEAFGYNVEGILLNYPDGNELVSSGIVYNAPAVYRLY